MPELIDRQAAIATLNEMQDKAATGLEDVTLYRAIKVLREMPTIEAEPVRHGRWDEIQCFSEHGIEMASYECTRCGNDIERQRGLVPPYCEFCGARMDATDTNVGGKGDDDNA